MDEHKIGVYVCNCGTNIAKVVDCEAVAEFALGQPGVTVAKSYKYMCSNPGQEMIVEDIKAEGSGSRGRGRLQPPDARAYVPQSPADGRDQPLLRGDGQHPRAVQLGARRPGGGHGQGAGAHARRQSRRVAYHEPLERRSVDMYPNVLVIGGGVVGMTAALELADGGNRVYLVERQDHLGGNVARVDLTAPYLDSARDMVTALVTTRSSSTRVSRCCWNRKQCRSRASSATSPRSSTPGAAGTERA